MVYGEAYSAVSHSCECLGATQGQSTSNEHFLSCMQSGCFLLLISSLLILADTVLKDERSNEFQTVVLLCFLSAALHLTVMFIACRARVISFPYTETRTTVDSVEEQQMRFTNQMLSQCFWVVEVAHNCGIFLFGLSAIYMIYVVL